MCVRICATRLKVAFFVVTCINGLICNEKHVFLIFPVTFQPKAALDDILRMFLKPKSNLEIQHQILLYVLHAKTKAVYPIPINYILFYLILLRLNSTLKLMICRHHEMDHS